jgi:hypothetical protein
MKELKKQIIIRPEENKYFYLPDKLKHDLDVFYYDMVDSEMDVVIVIDGAEGTGKSYTSRLIGTYFSFLSGLTFDHKNLHFTAEDYITRSERSPKFTVNILDESRHVLFKRRAMSKSNVMFTSWLSENRDKQQVHIILLPAIHDLDTYITMWRMSILIHHLKLHVKDKTSKSGYRLVRGYFRLYENNKDLQRVIFNKSKFGYYSYPKECLYTRKIKFVEVFDNENINKYKELKAKKRKEKYDMGENKQMVQRDILINELRKKDYSLEEISKLVDISKSAVSRIVKKQTTSSSLFD